MQRVHIVGRKNHGKTTLITDLVREFSSRGLRVATIKHTPHRHELDTPGKDSHAHRASGAAAAGIISPAMSAVFLPHDPAPSEAAYDAEDKEARYAQLAPMMAGCDLVLVEGHSQTDAPKLEVWRAEQTTEPLAAANDSILAIVTDDEIGGELPAAVTVLARRDVAALATWIVANVVESP